MGFSAPAYESTEFEKVGCTTHSCRSGKAWAYVSGGKWKILSSLHIEMIQDASSATLCDLSIACRHRTLKLLMATALNLPLRKHRPQHRVRVPGRSRRLEHAEPHRDGPHQHMRRRELAPIALARGEAREGEARFQRVIPSLTGTLAVMGDQPVEEFRGAVAGFAVSPNVSPKPSPAVSAGRKKPVWRVTTPSAATSSGVEAGKSRNISRDSSG